MSLPYPALSQDQKSRAEYLFCDSAFGTDPNAYLYEVDAGGEISGRIAENDGTVRTGGRGRNPGSRLTVREEAHITELWAGLR